MRITIDPFNVESIKSAERELKKYDREFMRKMRTFMYKLAEIGVHVAITGFENATYDGKKDVVVKMIPTNDGYSVVASGRTVGFIEFGTGIKYPEWDNSGMTYTPPPHGSYGKGLGGRRDENGEPLGWFYANKYTFGNPPAEAMRTARDEMVEKVMQIAREVWND